MVRVILAVVAIFVLWTATDFVIHGLMLGDQYKDEKHAALFFPLEEMRMPLLQLVVLAHATIFVKIYSWLISPKSILTGIIFGLLWGVGHGVGMGYGTYSTMRVPLEMATTWFSGAVVQGVLAGLVVALIVRRRDEPAVGSTG